MEFPTEFSEETKKQVALCGDMIRNKHRDDDEEIFCNDPLLIIEYNQPGLVSRNITEANVANVIRRTQNYIPIAFPKQHLQQSNSVIAFNSMQTIDEAIRDLYNIYHNTVIGRLNPIVGRVYVVEFRRANTFEVSERFHVFD
ncbi:1099_t:CDS:2 [Ambispora gerdemannii]|uniref:1099_t:CDS:1 n=1 Tax=Ambispora gerdemannii TaxID=144530 RepID=A0A9N9DPB7_9GLOM|nr:1099_t:CDS:2 [Ambispora gerdemannii]